MKIDRSGVIVNCSQCGRANRVAFGALARRTFVRMEA